MPSPSRVVLVLCLLITCFSLTAQAAPLFARQYGISCATCHSAFPELNDFGRHFMASNYRLANWKDTTVKTGDSELALPAAVPLAIRAQAYVQAREAEAVDVVSGERVQADTDFQSPYLVKLISSAPLSEHISYYFYGIFAEKGGNGEVVIEDAWFSHDDVLGSGVSLQLGQFQVSDLMFPRETRLTFQDYMVYRLAGITYERGVIWGSGFGALDVGIGLVNGNGIEENYSINSPGYRRPDHLFDNDNGKAAFIRVGADIGPLATGLFAYGGEQKNATGDAGTERGLRDTDKNILGLDLSGKIGMKARWFSQLLWNEWDGFLAPNTRYEWFGMFAGLNYVTGGKWTYALLYNFADAKDFDDSDTVYEGIDINSLTFNASYYFMRNVKGVIELNYDLLDDDPQTGNFYTGHLTRENSVLVGFDAAF